MSLNLLCTFHLYGMINHEVLWSAREIRSFVDQGFFQRLQPIDDDRRPGTNEKAEDVTIALGQLGTQWLAGLLLGVRWLTFI